VSLESTLARIAEISSALAPAPQQQQAPPSQGTGFQGALDGAMAGTASASAASAPAQGAPVQAAPGSYPHLRGDLDCSPELLQRLEALAAKRGETFNITSGMRSYQEQLRLWNNRGSNPFPVAHPGHSRHESGRAADVMVGGKPIQSAIPAAELRGAGLAPLSGDAVHVELP
jgi:LAS superfamily LD-carboxypeptidase LdcB